MEEIEPQTWPEAKTERGKNIQGMGLAWLTKRVRMILVSKRKKKLYFSLLSSKKQPDYFRGGGC